MAPSGDQCSVFWASTTEPSRFSTEARVTGRIFIRTFTGLYEVCHTRGGPLRGDMVDFPETGEDATGTSVLPMPFSKPHCRNNLAVSHDRPRTTRSRQAVKQSSAITKDRPGTECLFVAPSESRSTLWTLSLIRTEDLRKCCQPSSRRIVCGLSASQPGPGNAFRDPHFPISVPHASRGMLDGHDGEAVRE